MQDDPVAVDALAGRTARLEAPDRAQRLQQHPLELGQLHHAPGAVADGSEVAHLGHHEEALVPGVALRDRPEDVDVLDRGEPLEVEVLQPVQLQALGHHGVGVAEEGLLRVAPVRGRTEREVLHAARPRHREHDPAEGTRQGDPGQNRAHLRGVDLGVARALRPPEEHVAHGLPPGRGVGGEAAHAAKRRGEARVACVREEGVPAPPLALVAGDREGMALHGLDADLVEGADPVEAAQKHLEDRLLHRPGRRPVALHEQPGERLGALHEALHVGGPRLAARARPQGGQVALGGGEGLTADPLEERPLHEAESHLAGEIVHGRVAALRGRDQAIEERREIRDRRERRGLSVHEALEQQGHRGGQLLFPLVRLAHAVEALLELGRAGEVADAVVTQGPLQLREEGGGKAGPLLVQLPEVGEEVLLRAETVAVLPLLLVLALAPEERADVHEDVQDAGGPPREDLAGGALEGPGEGLAQAHGLHVEPQHQPAQLLERLPRAGRGTGGRRAQGVEVQPALAGVGHAAGLGVDDHQRVAGTHLDVRHHPHLADVPGERGVHGGLHLHGLEDEQGLPHLDLVAGLHGHRHHDRRSGSHDQPLRVASEGVGHALHLDEVRAPLHQREHAPGRARAEQAPLGGLEAPLPQGCAQPLDAHVHPASVLLHAVAVHGGAPHRDPVRLPSLPQLHRARGLGPHLRPPARGGGQEARLLGVRLGLVGLDGGAHQRQLGVAARGLLPASDEAVEEAHVEPPQAHLLAVDEVEQERLVRRAPAQDDRRLGEAPREPPERLLAVASVRDHLRDHRVELGRDEVALGDARVDAQAGPARQPQPRDRARGRGEAGLRVLGAQPHLDRVAGSGRRLAGEAAAPRHVHLQLHEVEPGGDLRDAVLHLEPRVGLEEPEVLAGGIVEELHGRGPHVPRGPDEARRRLPHRRLSHRGKARHRRFLDELLVAPLDGRLARGQRPHAAPRVAHHLHVHLADALEAPLQEDGGLAEPLPPFRPRALEGGRQRSRRLRLADAAPADARRSPSPSRGSRAPRPAAPPRPRSSPAPRPRERRGFRGPRPVACSRSCRRARASPPARGR